MAKRKSHDARRRFRKIMKGAAFLFEGAELVDVKHRSIILNEGHKHSAKLGSWGWEVDLGDNFENCLVISQHCHYSELSDVVAKFCTQNDFPLPKMWTAFIIH